jgi:hypothetical protein
VTLTRQLLVVVFHLRIKIGLHLLNRPVDLLPEFDATEFIP